MIVTDENGWEIIERNVCLKICRKGDRMIYEVHAHGGGMLCEGDMHKAGHGWLKWAEQEFEKEADDVPEQKVDDRAPCRVCGAPISDADHMDNGGRCDDCCQGAVA